MGGQSAAPPKLRGDPPVTITTASMFQRDRLDGRPHFHVFFYWLALGAIDRSPPG